MSKSTNRFIFETIVPFPSGKSGEDLIKWFNLQNFGTETKPSKISLYHRESLRQLKETRVYKFAFEINALGEWKFVGRID